jgi:hypothetical protein
MHKHDLAKAYQAKTDEELLQLAMASEQINRCHENLCILVAPGLTNVALPPITDKGVDRDGAVVRK